MKIDCSFTAFGSKVDRSGPERSAPQVNGPLSSRATIRIAFLQCDVRLKIAHEKLSPRPRFGDQTAPLCAGLPTPHTQDTSCARVSRPRTLSHQRSPPPA